MLNFSTKKICKCQKSNPGPVDGKRERYICAMPSPRLPRPLLTFLYRLCLSVVLPQATQLSFRRSSTSSSLCFLHTKERFGANRRILFGLQDLAKNLGPVRMLNRDSLFKGQSFFKHYPTTAAKLHKVTLELKSPIYH